MCVLQKPVGYHSKLDEYALAWQRDAESGSILVLWSPFSSKKIETGNFSPERENVGTGAELYIFKVVNFVNFMLYYEYLS